MPDEYGISGTLLGVGKLKRFKIKKVNLLDIVWMIYLTLMMSFVFIGAQQIYTICLLCITLVHIILTKGWRIRLSWFKGCGWYLIFAIFVNLSRLWSIYDYNETGITSWVLYITAAVFCLNYAFHNNSLRFFELLTWAGMFFSLVALITSPMSTYGTDEFSGITGQYRTWIGEISALLICINFYFYRYREKKRRYLIFGMFNLITVLASGARGALLLVVIIVMFIVVKEKKLNKKVLYALLGIIGAIVLGVIIFSSSALYNAFITRVLGAILNDGSTRSVTERIYFLTTAWDLFKTHPVLGCGVDAMRGHLSRIGYWHVTYAHSLYVELLSSYGIVGTLLFIVPSLKILFARSKNGLVAYLLPVMLIGFLWSVEYYSFIFIFLMEELQFFDGTCSVKKVQAFKGEGYK